MAKQNFTFGYYDYPALDGAGNIVLVGDPPHVVIPIAPIPIVHIHARNMHWRYLYGVLKITVNGVEREFHYTEGHTDSSMPADLGTIYIEEWDDGYAGWTINFKAFTINKSVQICQLSVSIETECDGLSTHPIQWEVSSFNASPPHLKDVYACIGYDIHLMDMQIDTQSRTGWTEIHKGVDPDKTCECGGDEPEPPEPPEPNLPETVYVTAAVDIRFPHPMTPNIALVLNLSNVEIIFLFTSSMISNSVILSNLFDYLLLLRNLVSSGQKRGAKC